MEKFVQVMSQLTVLIMMTMVMGLGGSCPPPEEEPFVDELVFYSDVVLWGEVVQRFPAAEDLYSVQMKVFCIYKGHEIPRMIDISDAGYQSESCPELRMEKGHQYVVYLYKHDHNVFTPAFPHHPDTYRDEMYSVCDLNITYPKGVEKGQSHVKCEDETKDYGDYPVEDPCVRYTPKPGDSKHRGKKTPPPQPGKTGKVEDNSENEDAGNPTNSTSSQPATSTPLLSALTLLLSSAIWALL